MKPKASVIIPTYNAARTIGECLSSLSEQTYSNLEMIVVDDGSTDKTRKEVSKFTSASLIKQSHQGPGLARNKGARKAKGEILVFVDADMIFDRRFIEELIKPIIGGKTKGTFTKQELVANWDKKLARWWNYEFGIKENRRIPVDYPNEAPVFRAILKSEFKRVGGFEPIGYTDDWTLSEKLGYRAIVAPEAICYHRNPDTWLEVWKQARWIGKRRYKWGNVGKILALVRASLPVSVLVGLVKAIRFKSGGFAFFKLYYDLAVFIAIVESLINRSNVK